MDLQVVAEEFIQQKILLIRGKKVILDFELAKLYGVETKRISEQVKRNSDRFPSDFMFRLHQEELLNLKSQIATSSWGGSRKMPYAFTEQGVAMLSSVLRSPKAVQVNIAIMRTFVKLRRILSTHEKLARKLEDLESKYDAQFRVVFDAIRAMMEEDETGEKGPIGFKFDE